MIWNKCPSCHCEETWSAIFVPSVSYEYNSSVPLSQILLCPTYSPSSLSHQQRLFVCLLMWQGIMHTNKETICTHKKCSLTFPHSLHSFSHSSVCGSSQVWYRVIQIVINRDDIQGYAAKTVFEALQAPGCHENMVKVGGYILGEFGNLIAGDPRSRYQSFFYLKAGWLLNPMSTRFSLLPDVTFPFNTNWVYRNGSTLLQ